MPLKLQMLAWALTFCACDAKGPPFGLSGSLSELLSLGFDEATIEKGPDAVALLFVRKRQAGAQSLDGGVDISALNQDVVLKITYALVGTSFPNSGRVDLATRGMVSRDVLNDTAHVFPAIIRGALSVDRSIDSNPRVNGDFNVTFENGTALASGRTVFGNFQGKVVKP